MLLLLLLIIAQSDVMLSPVLSLTPGRPSERKAKGNLPKLPPVLIATNGSIVPSKSPLNVCMAD